MSCIMCFFENHQQNIIKEKSYTNSKFEEALKIYKHNFINELKKLKSIEKCEYCQQNDYPKNFVEDTNFLLEDLTENYDYINKVFDEIINIYLTYITQGKIIAYNSMLRFLNETIKEKDFETENAFSKPMFRIRKKDNKYNSEEFYEYTHLPFNKRYLSGNNRFSVCGQPMIYMAESIEIALKETNIEDINNANLALFIPNPEKLKGKVYNITNKIIDILYRVLAFYKQNDNNYLGDYTTRVHTLSRCNFKNLISRTILYQIMTYPKKYSGPFIQEYVIPQLLMDVLNNMNEYNGIVYETSKQCTWKQKNIIDSFPDKNYCFFVPYIDNDDYNKEFLDKFFYSIYNEKAKKNNIDINNVEQLLNTKKFPGSINHHINCHINNMRICISEKYYETNIGKIESTLLYKLINKFEK
ncbi:hypothetical protein ACTPDI_17770 [Clostridioides difficile]|uniref:hypothetical protein n=1 Tax=Clostridioides sp. ZZV15-6598 TaxID=2811501 RepID=UPI001D11CA09|nr:hypothetical protein [Clostridioides sp. ZZV15-6598]